MGKDRRSQSSTPSPPGKEELRLGEIPLHSTNLLTLLDEDGVIQYESPAIGRVYGFSQDELVGDHVGEYFHPDDHDRVIEAFQRVVTSEEYTVESVEYRHRQADGSYLWVESVASADPTSEGHYVVNTRDISDRRDRERRLQQTNERLEGFASVVSHDLRNPLNVAQGRLELATEEVDSDHFPKIADAHERMATLIDELLALSRMEIQDGKSETVDIETITESCWQNVETEDATLDAEVDGAVQADRSRLQQLLENLMRNAVEHGGSEVTVTVKPIRDGFAFEDDGPGIPPEERDRVFDVGYSLSEGGTGFGLGIVKEVAESHGWTVRVTDSSAGGARFEITGLETS